jgi:hypothetical protein
MFVSCCNYLEAIEKIEKADEVIPIGGTGRSKAGRWRGRGG